MNVNKQQQHKHYQETLRVSDLPTSSSNHERMPSESSLLDEPIDVAQNAENDNVDVDQNSSFYIDDQRTYANFPSSANFERYQNNDQTLTLESIDNDVNSTRSSDIRAMSSTRVDDMSNDINVHDNSFDSLPPGDTYHIPTFDDDADDSDPFDTSAVVIPEVSPPRRNNYQVFTTGRI